MGDSGMKDKANKIIIIEGLKSKLSYYISPLWI